MIEPRVGLLAFAESRARNDVYQKRKPIWKREVERIVGLLDPSVCIIRPGDGEIRGKRDAVAAVQELRAAQIDAVILYPATFVAPALVAHAACLCDVPTALILNEAPDSLSQLAFLAVGGALDQIGTRCVRIPGDIGEDRNREALLAFLRAAAARRRLRGSTYGLIGGRSLGISTGTADVAEWERVFGVDIEHIDQFEIARRAQDQNPEIVARHVDWLRQNAAAVSCNDTNFTPAHLDKQVRSYLATKELVALHELDFMGVKCQPEMSNGFCLQCINVSLANDPYDADGPKEPIACSCEADADGAMTMQILKLLSGGRPTNLNDIAWMTANEMILANCGAMATYFAQPDSANDGAASIGSAPRGELKAGYGPSSDAGDSVSPTSHRQNGLSRVRILPHSFGEAGGAATVFTVPADVEMTFARLFRRNGRYVLGVLTGVTEEKDREAQSPTIRVRPLIFLRMSIDKRLFLESFGSNHIHGVEGNLKHDLRCLAEIIGIEFVDYDLD